MLLPIVLTVFDAIIAAVPVSDGLANLTLRQAGGTGLRYGVDISHGHLTRGRCDVSSQGLSKLTLLTH